MYKNIARKNIVSFTNSENNNYILKENAFTRNRKMNLDDLTQIIMGNNGKTLSLELEDYYGIKKGDFSMNITKQGFSKQRMNLDPQYFIDMNYGLIQEFIDNPEATMKRWKGYMVLAVDGTKMEIPHNKTTYEEFKLPWKGNKNKRSSRISVSCVVDVCNEFVFDTKVINADTSEEELIYHNIENITEHMDLGKFILIMDRGYPSIQLLQYLDEKNIKYLIRLPKSYYKEEREGMKTYDEEVEIQITKNRLNNTDPEIAEYIKTKKPPLVRITINKIKENELITITNLPKETLSKTEIKDLYHRRWKVEIAYDRLKNKEHIENFSGRKKITILQDLYAGTVLYNLILALKKDIEEENQINIDLKKQININLLIGICKKYFYELCLTKSKKRKMQIQEHINDFIIKRLLPTSKNEQNPRIKGPQNKYKTNNRKNF